MNELIVYTTLVETMKVIRSGNTYSFIVSYVNAGMTTNPFI